MYAFRLPEGQTRHHLMIGTQTDGEQNHLLLCTVDIPPKSGSPPRSTHDGVLRISKRIIHEGCDLLIKNKRFCFVS